MRRWLLLFLLAPALASASPAAGPIEAEVLAVTDGDTFRARAYPWPDIAVEISVRIAGIDAPELRGRCAEERALAARAKKRLAELLAVGRVTLRNVHQDKYAGRVDAEVEAGGVAVAAALVREGFARRYDGGRRRSWCG